MQDIAFRLQVPTPIEYKGLRLDCAYKADVVVQERVIVPRLIDGVKRFRI